MSDHGTNQTFLRKEKSILITWVPGVTHKHVDPVCVRGQPIRIREPMIAAVWMISVVKVVIIIIGIPKTD
jgi:hypothetical protein